MSGAPGASRAIMASRREAPDGLDDFPTPPWGTRALTQECLPAVTGRMSLRGLTVQEPTANRGLMVAPLQEDGADVWATDVWDYGAGFEVRDYLAGEVTRNLVDWTVFNPPFNAIDRFLARALVESAHGVAMFAQSRWREGEGRYREILSVTPPSFEFQFAERICLKRGRWDPDGSTATAYSWFIWLKDQRFPTRWLGAPYCLLGWIEPGARERCTRPDDVQRFAGPFEAPLFDGAAP